MPDIIRRSSGGGTAADFTPVVTITAVADQDTTDAVSLSLATVTLGGTDESGNVTAYAWTANGATTGFDDAASATPTFTPTALIGRVYTLQCTVTIGGEDYDSEVEVFQVGDASGHVKIPFDDVTFVDGTVTGSFVSATADTITLDGDQGTADGINECPTATVAGYEVGYRYSARVEITGTPSSGAFITVGIEDTADGNPGSAGGAGVAPAAGVLRLASQTTTGITFTAGTNDTRAATGETLVGASGTRGQWPFHAFDASDNLLGSTLIGGNNTTITTGRLFIAAGLAGTPGAGNQTISGAVWLRKTAL